jgi:opacity protein-like surface antigen
MKKSACLLASGVASIALGLAATPTLAQQRSTAGGLGFIDYVGAQLAISDIDGFDNGLALVLNAGKELNNLPGLAVEGELTTTVSSPEADIGGISAEASYWTLAGYGVYTIPLNQQVGLRGKVGALYENVDVDVSGAGDESDDEFGLSLGVGATFRMSPKMNLIAEYTRIEEDVNHLSAGVQFRF